MKKGIKKLAAVILAGMMSMSTLAMTVSADKWVEVNNGYKYQYDNGKYAKKGWLTIGKNKYYIKQNGFRATGMVKITETENKKKVTNYYYFDEDGAMQTGWQEINDKKYYFNSKTGKRVTNKTVKIGSYSYKFDKNGVWTGKVYDSTGKKDVTKSVDKEKLTAVKATTATSTTKTPEGVPTTVTIKGKTYYTQVTNHFVNGKADPVYPKGDADNENGKQLRWEIDISGCTDKDLECLKYFTNLVDLTLTTRDWTNPAKITNLDFAYNMPNLKYVTIDVAPYLTNIDGLSASKKIESVYIDDTRITNLDALSGCTKLKTIMIFFSYLENVNGLKDCNNLEHVEIGCNRLTDITGFANKDKLKLLNLDCSRRLKDITPLVTCKNLKKLYLNSCTSINTWDTLKEMKWLSSVACLNNVIGKDGPAEVAEWLKANTTVTANYKAKGTEVFYISDRETKAESMWDPDYRPEKVYGDDLDCSGWHRTGETCSYCGNVKFHDWQLELKKST